MDDTPIIELVLYFSSKLQSQGPLEMLSKLSEAGANFIEIGTDLELGNIVGKYSEDPTQNRFRFVFNDSTYSITAINETGHLLFAGAIDFVDPVRNQRVADSLIPLARTAMEAFAFRYGYLDIQGGKSPAEKEVLAAKLTRIFKVNFFGLPYVDKYGKEFLMGAPGWRTAELPGGAIEHLTTRNVLAPIDKLLEQEIIQYFALKAKVKMHKPVPF